MRRGILPEAIVLQTELEAMLVPHDVAVSIGIVVNELVTNACKHAFGDGGGTIWIRAYKQGDGARIEVADDGKGFTPVAKDPGGLLKVGLGTRLIAAFVQRMGGHAEVRSNGCGTLHSIYVPLRQR
jgi:two-component sensor histidine kinase